jgi:hypothetical protein
MVWRSNPCRCKIFFSSPECLKRPWGRVRHSGERNCTDKIHDIHITIAIRWATSMPWIPTKMNCYSIHNYKQLNPFRNNCSSNIINYPILLPKMGPRWSSGYGTVLQIGRSLVRFPMVPLEFFIDIILSIALRPWGRLSL